MRKTCNPTTTCAECTTQFLVTEKWKRDNLKAGKPVYCSKECGKSASSRKSSATMANTNRKYASARMLERNPMKRQDVRDKVSLAMKGRCPVKRGGNGQEMPLPQRMMAEALRWPTEVAVPTKMPRDSGYPTCYKLDLANTELKVGVEIDGHSHAPLARQEQDKKKVAFLSGLEWTVLRFSNQEVMENLAGCVQTVMSTISKLKDGTPTPPTGS